MAITIQVEHLASRHALVHLIDLLNDWLVDNPELRRIFAILIRAVVLRRSKHAEVLPKIDDLKELKMTLTARFETWAEEFEQRGIEKGLLKGEALALQRLLVKRFGPLSDHAAQQIESATADQIDLWIDRVLDAQSLNDVLRSS